MHTYSITYDSTNMNVSALCYMQHTITTLQDQWAGFDVVTGVRADGCQQQRGQLQANLYAGMVRCLIDSDSSGTLKQ